MLCHLPQATCRTWIRLLTTGVPRIPSASRAVARSHRCSARALSSASSASHARTQPSASAAASRANTTHSDTSTRRPADNSRPAPLKSKLIDALTPDILSQFHNTTPAQACQLITSLLTQHSATLTPGDFTTLIRLAHSFTPAPHTLVLTVYDAFARRWGPQAAPAELFQFVLPVLFGHDRHREVLRLWDWVVRLEKPVDQVLLGVVLRACVVQRDGTLAWEIFSKYRSQPRIEGVGESTLR